MKLKDDIPRDRDRVKALVDDGKRVTVSGDFLLITIPGRGFLLNELPDSGVGSHDPLDGI